MTTVAPRLFTAGALTYTRPGLVSLFAWLIWGDFVLAVMEQLAPRLLPLLLKDHGATDGQIVIIVSTLAMVMNAALNPLISYNSDRFRSRWGRRRPFIFVTTPFVVLFLAAIPFAPEILHRFGAHGLPARLLVLGPWPPLMVAFALLVVGYQTFNMFVATTYYYLLPDVIPQNLLGRFYALFRTAGAMAVISFNYFVFGLAETHMKEIFVITAVLYGFFILLMCWRVKEGDYPPPAREDHAHAWSGVANYARECYGHSFYWLAFAAYSVSTWIVIGNVFQVFFYRDELGFSLDLVGRVTAGSSLLFILSAYPLGILVDHWGCHRSLILSYGLSCAFSLGMFFFATRGVGAIVWAVLRDTTVLWIFLSLAKWTVEVYPRERFGQFSSAGALVASLGGIALGPLCAWWIGWAGSHRFLLLWSADFSFLGLVMATLVYRRWKLLGGPGAYCAP